MSKEKAEKKTDLTFEQALSRLEEIVVQLESGEEGLDESIALFEEGTKLSRLCQEKLAQAQIKIEKLVESAGGKVSIEDLEVPE